jgi:hypothetical protein
MKTAMRLAVVMFGALAAACGGTQKPDDKKSMELSDQPPVTYETPPGEEKPPEVAPAGENHLELAEMTVFQGKTPVYKLHADGTTEVPKAGGGFDAGPVIKADGTFVVKDQPVLRVGADGSFALLPSGEKVPRTVTPDNVTADQGGKQIGFALAEDGALALIGQPAPRPGQELRVEGAATPGQRKAVLAFLGALMK